MWVNRPLQVIQLGQLSLSSFRIDKLSSEQLIATLSDVRWWRHLVSAHEVKAGAVHQPLSAVCGLPFTV